MANKLPFLDNLIIRRKSALFARVMRNMDIWRS